jgi:RHS repeat-associated protein
MLPDALGSVIGLTDDTGALVKQYSYEPFGETASTGETNDNSYQYTGRENDGTGLYYYRARYYHPQMKRFISEDPYGVAGGVNLYQYVGGMPTMLIDPLGLLWTYCSGSGNLYQQSGGSDLYNYQGNGYSGAPGFQKPSDIGPPGPAPGGFYTISPEKPFFSKPDPGPTKPGMRIKPDEPNGRGGLLIHKDNGKGNKSASIGCIVLSDGDYDAVKKSKDNRLQVDSGC